LVRGEAHYTRPDFAVYAHRPKPAANSRSEYASGRNLRFQFSGTPEDVNQDDVHKIIHGFELDVTTTLARSAKRGLE
jgi:hypothetical protein